ncbi:kinase-like domain-containing protein [Lasiosphaeria ovina]|uniref:Kinase-like domain-containing protein n=1 Tax=Lasiosphaeria ovina TaxID=92902 RepID=A0AAE0KLQ0_9PEZI|nr:kinase-like domain-containing protein [Lasiosphaeria ovina]
MANFPPTYDQIEGVLKAFIDSIDLNAVCSLASLHNSSKNCRMFRDAASGSYNVCYFVEFDDGTQWVVRIPLEPCISNVWDKVQSEVATIRYLQAKTTIPVPNIHAFGRGGVVDEKNPTGHAYIIQSYIPGETLNLLTLRKMTVNQRMPFYSELVDFFAQLRQQEFPCGGSLMPDPDGGTAPLVGPLLSMQLNELQLENRDLNIQPATFASATDFAFHQYHLLDESLRLPYYKFSQATAEHHVFGMEDLKKRLSDHIDDHGPFVLSHTDLRPSNIIVDENMHIKGIIDWEWAGTVPRQFFLPPTWIAGLPPDRVAGVEFKVEYIWFRDALIEATSERCRQLASEWDRRLPRRIDMPLAVTLQHSSCFVNMYYTGIFPHFHKGSREEVIREFFGRDGKDGKFSLEVQQRLSNSKRYAQYLDENGLAPSCEGKEGQGPGEPPKG